MKSTKKIILGIASLMLICGCGTIPTTEDGKEAIVTFEKEDSKHEISADDLYQLLKNKYGLDELVTLIDTYVFESEFEDYKTTAKDYANNYIKSMKTSFKTDEEFLAAIKQNTNYQTVDEYRDYIYLTYLQSHAIEEYAKSLVTDKQVENYYNDELKENVEVYHILITPEQKDNMTETEKTEAEKKAKTKAENLLKEINESKDKISTFKKLVKDNSNDNSTKDKDGNLGFINEFTLGSEYDEVIKAAYNVKDGEVYDKVVTSELGYHIILRNASKEKDTLDEMKENILEKLSNQVMAADSKFAVNTLKHYRELYNLDIIDSELNSSYRTYMNELGNVTTNNNQ